AAVAAEAIRTASRRAAQVVFGQTPVLFPFTTAVVECYADAKGPRPAAAAAALS
ncbi:hypothetical protein HCK01_21265, partial [Streptomyces sp. AA8]|nr:hypothetical protein [Streptomyces telluris]